MLVTAVFECPNGHHSEKVFGGEEFVPKTYTCYPEDRCDQRMKLVSVKPLEWKDKEKTS